MTLLSSSSSSPQDIAASNLSQINFPFVYRHFRLAINSWLLDTTNIFNLLRFYVIFSPTQPIDCRHKILRQTYKMQSKMSNAFRKLSFIVSATDSRSFASSHFDTPFVIFLHVAFSMRTLCRLHFCLINVTLFSPSSLSLSLPFEHSCPIISMLLVFYA